MKNYSFSKEKFKAMSIKDIWPEEDIDKLWDLIEKGRKPEALNQGVLRYRRKNGEVFKVDIQNKDINFNGRPASRTSASDISSQMRYIHDAIEKQNLILRDIAWIQSHVVRAPLARIIGLVNLLEEYPEENNNYSEVLNYLRHSANELDEVVRAIVRKAEQIETPADGTADNNCR